MFFSCGCQALLLYLVLNVLQSHEAVALDLCSDHQRGEVAHRAQGQGTVREWEESAPAHQEYPSRWQLRCTDQYRPKGTRVAKAVALATLQALRG